MSAIQVGCWIHYIGRWNIRVDKFNIFDALKKIFKTEVERQTNVRYSNVCVLRKKTFLLLTSTKIPTKKACIISLASTECLVSSNI